MSANKLHSQLLRKSLSGLAPEFYSAVPQYLPKLREERSKSVAIVSSQGIAYKPETKLLKPVVMQQDGGKYTRKELQLSISKVPVNVSYKKTES